MEEMSDTMVKKLDKVISTFNKRFDEIKFKKHGAEDPNAVLADVKCRKRHLVHCLAVNSCGNLKTVRLVGLVVALMQTDVCM